MCVMGNGISNMDGKVEQTAQVKLVVQGNITCQVIELPTKVKWDWCLN
jgi:hypothetical protein